MWNEKARPSRIDDIAGNPDLKSDILSWQQNGAPAALLFVGPPGTGKTTTARVIANMMLGDEMHVNYEETNGSDDRGISFIREDLKTFLRVKPVGVDRKVILIDEADGLTTQAQDAMRQLIENYSHNALIIMTANEMEKIRPAIRSRCATYTFKPLTSNEGAARLWDVCKTCGVPDGVLKEWSKSLPALVEQMNGDLRSCINILESLPQTTLALYNRVEKIQAMASVDLAELVVEGQFMKLRSKLHAMLDNGSDLRAVMSVLYRDMKKQLDASLTDTSLFDAMVAYGDIMTHIYTWPDNAHSFCDYMVAAIRRETR
tara:strand:- start:1960 stop:2907 length:948 start_codon:yes stop_codon:yes gene_type:complete